MCVSMAWFYSFSRSTRGYGCPVPGYSSCTWPGTTRSGRGHFSPNRDYYLHLKLKNALGNSVAEACYNSNHIGTDTS